MANKTKKTKNKQTNWSPLEKRALVTFLIFSLSFFGRFRHKSRMSCKVVSQNYRDS